MKRQDDVTIILDEYDKALITRYEDGGIGIHNIGWSIQMPESLAEEIALDLLTTVRARIKEKAA